jgi:hypothetical protein
MTITYYDRDAHALVTAEVLAIAADAFKVVDPETKAIIWIPSQWARI